MNSLAKKRERYRKVINIMCDKENPKTGNRFVVSSIQIYV